MKAVAETLRAPIRHFNNIKWPLLTFQASDFAVHDKAAFQRIPDSASFAAYWRGQPELAVGHSGQLHCGRLMGGGQGLIAFLILVPRPGWAIGPIRICGAGYDGDVVSGFGKAMGQAVDI